MNSNLKFEVGETYVDGFGDFFLCISIKQEILGVILAKNGVQGPFLTYRNVDGTMLSDGTPSNFDIVNHVREVD